MMYIFIVFFLKLTMKYGDVISYMYILFSIMSIILIFFVAINKTKLNVKRKWPYVLSLILLSIFFVFCSLTNPEKNIQISHISGYKEQIKENEKYTEDTRRMYEHLLYEEEQKTKEAEEYFSLNKDYREIINDMIMQLKDNLKKSLKITTTEKKQYNQVIAYKSGKYTVGKTIPEGEYRLYTRGKCDVFCASSDSGKIEDDLYSLNLDNETMYVTLNAGDFFNFTSGVMFPLGTEPSDSECAISNGMYKIGRDISPGDFKVVPMGENPYYIITNDSMHKYLKSNENYKNSAYDNAVVTLKDKEYVILKNCKLIKIEK